MKLMAVLFLFVSISITVDAQTVSDQPFKENLKRWQQFSPEKKQKLKQKFEELQSMSPAERQNFLENAKRFQDLPYDQKEKIRKRFELLQSLTPEQRQTIRKFVQRYRSMPHLRKEAFHHKLRRLRMMTPEQREYHLERSPFWPRLNDSQKDAIRKFLRSKGSDADVPSVS